MKNIINMQPVSVKTVTPKTEFTMLRAVTASNLYPKVCSLAKEEDLIALCLSKGRTFEKLPDAFRLIQSGVFLAPEIHYGTLSGIYHCLLRLSVQLNIKDSKGVPFIAQRTYNFADRGHGRSAIIRDYENWTGKKLAGEQLWAFDPRKFTVGKPVAVELEVRSLLLGYDLRIKAFMPRKLGSTKASSIVPIKEIFS